MTTSLTAACPADGSMLVCDAEGSGKALPMRDREQHLMQVLDMVAQAKPGGVVIDPTRAARRSAP